MQTHKIRIYGWSDDLIEIDHIDCEDHRKSKLDKEFYADYDSEMGVVLLKDEESCDWVHVRVMFCPPGRDVWVVEVLDENRSVPLPKWAREARYVHGDIGYDKDDFSEIVEMDVPLRTVSKLIFPKPEYD